MYKCIVSDWKEVSLESWIQTYHYLLKVDLLRTGSSQLIAAMTQQDTLQFRYKTSKDSVRQLG